MSPRLPGETHHAQHVLSLAGVALAAFETVLGTVRLDAKGDVRDPTYDINVWKDGKYAAIAQ